MATLWLWILILPLALWYMLMVEVLMGETQKFIGFLVFLLLSIYFVVNGQAVQAIFSLLLSIYSLLKIVEEA